jgi:hypothetical protein
VSTVIELACEAEVEQTGCVDGEDFEAKRVFFYGLKTEFVGGWDAVVLIEGLGADAQDVDIFPGHQNLEHVVPPHLLARLGYFLDIVDFRLIDLPEPLILSRKVQSL